MTWDFIHRWYMPFVWIALTSLVTVPMAMYFQHGMEMRTGAEIGLPYGDLWVLRDDFLESIVPYLIGLICAIWLLDADGTTRWAAFWALLLAIVRIVAPLTLASMADAPMPGGEHYIDWNVLRLVIWYTDIQLFVLGLAVWAIFARFEGESAATAPVGAYAEAH